MGVVQIFLYHQDFQLLSSAYLERHKNWTIIRAINKYDLKTFALIILEFVDRDKTKIIEQKWLDILEPEYNILKFVGSSKDYKASLESRQIKVAFLNAYWKIAEGIKRKN